MKIPAVIRYIRLIKPRYKSIKFSKINIHYRDDFTCLYCGVKQTRSKLTIDHVIPRCKNGQSSWSNCVSACIPCNVRKADKTIKEANMKLIKEPKQPSQTEAFMLIIKLNSINIPPIWRNYSPLIKQITT